MVTFAEAKPGIQTQIELFLPSRIPQEYDYL